MAVKAYNTITLISIDDAVWEIIDGYWYKNGINQDIKAEGEDGLDGLSAYELAVIGGYEGTETEFNDELASMEDTRQRVDNIETHTARLDVKLSSIQTEVSALGGGNIISNILGEFGVMDWTFESAAWEFQSVAPYPLFGTGLLFGGVNTQIMYPILPDDTLSGKGFRIFNAGKALSEYAIAEGGANYSFYTRYRGTGTVTFLLREYNTATPLNKDSFTRETAYGTTSAAADWTTANGTIELLPDTKQVILVVDSQVSVRDGEFLETSDTSVNMGNPRAYAPSLTDINTKATYAATTAEQTAEGFTLLAADQSLIEGRVSNAESQISIQAGQISNKVERDGVISSINQTPESITIDASKINLSGYVTVSSLGSSGTTTIHGNRIQTSTIEADKFANIAGFTFSNSTMTATNSGNYVRISGASGYNPIRVGPSSSDIRFQVGVYGNLTATGADISGKITATSGTIGGLGITSAFIEYRPNPSNNVNRTYFSGNPNDTYVFASYNSSGTRTFSIARTGGLYATGADISGKITATSGKIAGLTFDNYTMTGDNSGNYVRISGASGYIPIRVGPSSSDIRFQVNQTGNLTATSATVTGNITANSSSTLGGSLNSTSGRHSGTHYGYHSGTADNYSGTFGGVPYQGYSGTLVRMYGSLTIDTGYLSCNRTLYANAGIVDGSDIHYKKDIHQKDNSSLMNEIYNLDVVSFKYKDNNKDSIGVIANNMVLESPTLSKYMVEPNPEGYLSVNYTSLNTASILAIQDLNKRLEKLERAMV